MKICVTAQAPTLDSLIDPRFGRCANFIIVDSKTLAFEAAMNPGTMASGGAGIHAAQFIAEQGCKAVLTGNVGPNAYNALAAAGITVFVGISGTVKSAIEMFNSGQLTPTSSATAPSHSGMGGGRGTGRGMGRRGQR